MNDETILLDAGLEPVPAEVTATDPSNEVSPEVQAEASATPVQDEADTEGTPEVITSPVDMAG